MFILLFIEAQLMKISFHTHIDEKLYLNFIMKTLISKLVYVCLYFKWILLWLLWKMDFSIIPSSKFYLCQDTYVSNIQSIHVII